MLAKALELAYKYHAGQFDKAGCPYILHPVYISTKFEDEKLKVVALLHDTLEDTDLTENKLREYGFDEDIIEAVLAITKQPWESYSQYMKRVMCNELAIQIKLEDMKHNMDKSRLDKDIQDLDEHIQYMFKKYDKWLPRLEQRINE